MISSRITEATSELKRQIGARFGDRLIRMTLFGSWARGDALPESDVDVLVVVEGMTATERRGVYDAGAEVFMETGVLLAPLALSSAEWNELVRLERLLPDEIARDGVAV